MKRFQIQLEITLDFDVKLTEICFSEAVLTKISQDFWYNRTEFNDQSNMLQSSTSTICLKTYRLKIYIAVGTNYKTQLEMSSQQITDKRDTSRQINQSINYTS